MFMCILIRHKELSGWGIPTVKTNSIQGCMVWCVISVKINVILFPNHEGVNHLNEGVHDYHESVFGCHESVFGCHEGVPEINESV